MSRGARWILIAVIVLFLLLLILVLVILANRPRPETFTVANWNLQVFGDSKEEDERLMQAYAQKIARYDVVFVQEIRDADGSSLLRLCYLLQNHSCTVSSRAGRTSSKEQYGIIYRSVGPRNFTLVELKDYNPDPLDRFERPPARATLITGNATANYTFVAYNIHIKPSAAAEELAALDELVTEETARAGSGSNIVVLGDLNADCSYYDESSKNAFAGWYWAISDSSDTTTGSSSCAYDRIIMNGDALGEFAGSGIDSAGVTTDVSDHYLVWAAFRPQER